MSRCHLSSHLALAAAMAVIVPACVDPGADSAPTGSRSPPAAPDALAFDCGCDDTRAPVCGDDRRTYDSACQAACAGVGVVDPEPCQQPCREDGDCAAGEFCDLGECDDEGICRSTADPGWSEVYEPPVCGCENDVWEPNDLPESAALLPLEGGDEVGAYLEIRNFFLCPGESDWYRLSPDMLEHEYDGFSVSGVVGGDFCACGGELPDAPENAMALEIYDAETFELLGSDVSANGRPSPYTAVPPRELLIHVYSPTETATYMYGLFILLGQWNWGDDCEC